MPNPKEVTHLLRHHDSRMQNGQRIPATTELFRSDNEINPGMKLGEQVGCVVFFGENPQKLEQRFFKDEASATKFLHKVANEDAGRLAIFEDENATPMVHPVGRAN